MPERLRSDARKRLRIVGPSTARGRFRAILPVLRFRARKALDKNHTVTLASGAEILELTELAKSRARQAHVTSRTVFRWLKRFDHGGYAALAEKPRKDRGISRFFSKHPLVVAFVVTRYLDGWHLISIHEALRQFWARLRCGSSPLPHLDTLREFLKSMLPARVAKRYRNG